jgi:hypothetical protein
VVNTSYNGLEVRNNRINYLGRLLVVNSGNVLTNSVIRDNDAGVLSQAPVIRLRGSTNVDIIGNTFESTATSGNVVDLGTATNINFINNTFKYVSSGNGVTGTGTNIVLRGNRITAAASGVGHAIDIGGTNWTVEENTIDMSLGGGYAVNIGAVNAIVRANNIVGTRDNPAVYVGATNALVEGNRIQNVVYTTYSGTASAIYVTSSGGNATIRNNTIEKVRGADAIRVDADNVVVTLNTITQVECIRPDALVGPWPRRVRGCPAEREGPGQHHGPGGGPGNPRLWHCRDRCHEQRDPGQHPPACGHPRLLRFGAALGGHRVQRERG